jgi:L-fucose/D-arabinose isomerase
MSIKVALATLGDSRDDFYARRAGLVAAELERLDWLRAAFAVIESPVIRSTEAAVAFAAEARAEGAQALVVHVPIWADPILTVKLRNHLPLPVLLLGNPSPETSSMVGILGAGGALDQIGIRHVRILDHTTAAGRGAALACLRAAGARAALNGQTLGLFGGRSLGIFTAGADPAQWQRLFGVDIASFDQAEIIAAADALPGDEVEEHCRWLTGRAGSVEYGGRFTLERFEKQVRSYLATRELIARYGLDFVGVKCQPEMSDGYVSQCVAHMLLNSTADAGGSKTPIVHACESDADGALTMQILHLLSGGRPAALLDIRWWNMETGVWTLANCGALPADFFATEADPQGLAAVQIVPHVFGQGGGGALPAVVAPQPVTLARLCRRDGEYWLAIVAGQAEAGSRADLLRTTPAFPQAFVRASAGQDFVEGFGSNHIHMVSGDYTAELIAFCRLAGLRWQLWN